VRTCSNCGQESPAGFRFCPYCGQLLPEAEAKALEAERKVVTVMFCDLVGFTTRADRADPEDVRGILRPFHELARTEIERYGGTLDKFIGDAAMGVFGSPAAHEDDPERAVRAAMGILQGIAVMNERGSGEALAVRIGINTGEAIVTMAAGVQAGENVAGDVVNTASRLQSAAPSGAVIVGEATHRMSAGAIHYEEMESMAVKGKAEPLRVWRAVAIRPLPTISDRVATSPYVGRGRELAVLEQALIRILTEPAVQLITIIGEPGAGKSRLVAEARSASARLASDGRHVQWLRGRCLPFGDGITFWALGEIVKGRTGILESDVPEERDRKLAFALDKYLIETDERAWLRARLAPLVGVEGGSPIDRDEAFAAWRRFLEIVARGAPMVVVFEDIHWADPSMLAFIEHLALTARHNPLLIIVTARPELGDRYPGWPGGLGNAIDIPLEPLSDEETTELVATLLHTESIPPQTRALLVHRSGGNPLYAEEFARTLQDRGLVDDQGRSAGDLPDIEFPQTLQALIAARLDTVGRHHKSVLQDASVIGRVFWSGAVAFVGEADPGGVVTDLTELGRRQFLRPVPAPSFRNQSEFSFWHAVVRDVAYGQIPRGPRAAKHRRAAAWIEREAGERLADLAEILAHHATSALELAEAAGEADDLDDLREAAARYLRLAGVRTMSLDVDKAERQLMRALDLIPPGHPDRPRVLASLAEAAFQAGRLEEADVQFEEAIAGLRLADIREAADAMTRRSVVLEYRGEVAAGKMLLSDAIELLEGLPVGPELARALATSSGVLMVSARYEEAVQQAERAIELAGEAGEPAAAARAHGFRGYSRAIQGDLGGVEEQRIALASLRATGLGRATAVAYNNLGSCLLHLEGAASALEALQEGLAFAEARGLRESVMAIQNSMLTVLFERGDWDELLRLCEEVVAEARRQGSGHDEVYAQADRAVVLALRQGSGAREFSESVLERARSLEYAPVILVAIIAAGLCHQASGDHQGTKALIREALEMTTGESMVERVAHLPELVRLAAAAGDPGLADQLMDGTDELPLERYRLARLASEAVVAEASSLPDLERALMGHERASKEWARWGNPLEMGYALFGAGRCLVRLGRSAEARERLDAAAKVFAKLQARLVLDDIQAFSD
jgi:class 3 adenylate cyclase/tetratricopeptide (TPR) repeat protein